jgi:competence protein ComEA
LKTLSNERPKLHDPLMSRVGCKSWIVWLCCCAQIGLAQEPPPAKSFERFDGCVLVPHRWNDGDTFRVKLPNGREESFRLYFVDTPETTTRLLDRNDDAVKYFGLEKDAISALAQEASKLTSAALAKPFTLYTRWRPVFASNRYYALVRTAEGQDLGELLVGKGLAQIRGLRIRTPAGREPADQVAHLQELEKRAQQHGLGGWKC